jgi:hypothetical protein
MLTVSTMTRRFSRQNLRDCRSRLNVRFTNLGRATRFGADLRRSLEDRQTCWLIVRETSRRVSFFVRRARVSTPRFRVDTEWGGRPQARHRTRRRGRRYKLRIVHFLWKPKLSVVFLDIHRDQFSVSVLLETWSEVVAEVILLRSVLGWRVVGRSFSSNLFGALVLKPDLDDSERKSDFRGQLVDGRATRERLGRENLPQY